MSDASNLRYVAQLIVQEVGGTVTGWLQKEINSKEHQGHTLVTCLPNENQSNSYICIWDTGLPYAKVVKM